MNLLTNAVEAIQVGVADWREGSRPRLLASVRNIHAGILLLYKEALLRLSPAGSDEVLIKARQVPVKDDAGQVQYKGVGKKTVNTHQIKERFKGLGISTDWKRLDQITAVRNEIEHYFPNATQDSIRGVVAGAFVIIRAFCVEELDEEPLDLFGRDTWEAMLAANELYELERKTCDQAIAALDWYSPTVKEAVAGIRCTTCGSDLLIPKDGGPYSQPVLECRLCASRQDAEEYVPTAIEEALGADQYAAFADGAESPTGVCPNCFEETYVMEEGMCALCGEAVEQECSRCGQAIPPEELASSPLCGYCDHIMSKAD